MNHRPKAATNDGYTMTEVIIAVIIVAALGGLAIPTYMRSVEAARSQEAKGDLQQIYQGQRIYKLNNSTYWNPGATPPSATVDSVLKTSLKTEYYSVSSIIGDATTFTATMTRAPCPPTPPKTFSIDQGGNLTESGDYCS